MGIRACLVVCVTSFLLGALFTNWIADSLTLWKQPVTDAHLWEAASYYAIVSKGPEWLYYVLAAIVTLGAGNIFWSLCDGEAGNLMFDGGSIFLYMTTLVMYTYNVVPNILSNFASLPVHDIGAAVPSSLRTHTLDLASSNLISSVALTGVMVFQAGRHWAEKSDEEPQVSESKSDSAKEKQS